MSRSPGKARLDKARPQGQRAGQNRKPNESLQRNGQRHHRQLRAKFAEQRDRNLDEHGGGKNRRGQFDRGEKNPAGRLNNRTRG